MIFELEGYGPSYTTIRIQKQSKQGFPYHLEPPGSGRAEPKQSETGMIRLWKMVRTPEPFKKPRTGPKWYGMGLYQCVSILFGPGSDQTL